MDKEAIKQFQSRLLEWYDSNARVLPWRNDPSPYRVWISEIMLQQTRVEAVKPYFERFMEAVPSIEHLADISEDQLLKLWEGLGYYSRAKNLKKAAAVVMQDFGGELPADISSLQALPGIGPYTSGAIASIAFGIKTPAVDGNVLRVIARVTANEGDISDRITKKQIEELVYKMLPENRAGDFNQALMELGATVCSPNGAPKCSSCPVQALCIGHEQGIADKLPKKAKKKERRIELKTVFVIAYNGEIAIRQRPADGLLSSLWEFPNEEEHLSPEESKRRLLEWGVVPDNISPLGASKHIFTHLEWHMIGYSVTAQHVLDSEQFVWASWEEIKKHYSIPTALKAYLRV